MDNKANISSNISSWWQPQDGELFDIFCAYKKVGSCSLALVDNQRSPRKEQQFFPDSWFVNTRSDQMLSILEVTGLETIQQKNSGNGRLCLQALYELSKRRACGGRIQLFSDFNSAAFYEHCGFSGGVKGESGLKFFDPTDKNLTLLFPNGMEQANCRFIPVSLPQRVSKKLSQTDKALFERMLQKGQHS